MKQCKNIAKIVILTLVAIADSTLFLTTTQAPIQLQRSREMIKMAQYS